MPLAQPHHLGRLAAAAVLVLGPWFLASCDNGDGTGGGYGTGDTTDTAAETNSEPAPQDGQAYFANGDHLGEKVSVTAAVDVPLNERALVLNAGEYGDNSLLVLLDQKAPNFQEGDLVTATGTVENFTYEQFSEKYNLVQAAIYDGYTDEQFLNQATVEAAKDAPTG
ncbi:hypothetical protein SAMN05216266_11186 [Amycolatopsis marina]|uniref:Uncharacterized protein n=1 Tax=Amycolatopsis marina TaxID=490629 RepID=A0A1I1AZ63_9PSEU|nr:hypothetical protein [Amycolatopsis marina]SFB43331.1 hypothetical protein SAMN05216266_11186 [Amycolatopsis marina]